MTRHITEAERAIKNAENYIRRRGNHKRQVLIDHCDEMIEYFVALARSQVKLAKQKEEGS